MKITILIRQHIPWRLAALALSLIWGVAHAQNSQLSGRVFDPSRTLVPSARITLIRPDNGDRREASSNAGGFYAFPLLTPGVYDLTVHAEGFQANTHRGIRVETGTVTSIDVVLALGDYRQSVEVRGGAPLLQTESAAVSKVVTNEAIANMPLIDRRSIQLLRLNGFIVQNNSGSSVSFSVAGGRSGNTNYYVDGGTVQNVTLGDQGIYFDPPVEALQEFNVNMSTYSAELGRSGGAVVQMTTKSGTNALHGSAYEYFRNDALNANTYFAAQKPVLRYNLFGASLGGPVIRNRTWFFFNYEGQRQVLATTKNLTVPKPAELTGDFSAGTAIVNDPVTSTPFPGNIIPTSRIDAVAAKLAPYYPAPNIAQTSGGVNYVGNVPGTTTMNNYVARLDHVFGDRDRIMGRLLGQPDEIAYRSLFPVSGSDPYGYLTHEYYYNAAGNWDHVITPTMFNQFRLTYCRRQRLSTSASANETLGARIGLSGVPSSYFPSVTVTGYAGLGDGTGAPNGNGQYRSQSPVYAHLLSDSLTWMAGRHQLKAGFEYRYAKSTDIYAPTAGGALTFNNLATGSSVASLLLGWVNQGSVVRTEQISSRMDTYAAFLQDDWRITPALTLSLGLRYDVDSPRREVNNRQNSFDPQAINPVSGTPGVITFAGINGQSRFANQWDLNNVGPRFGFAWKANDKLVVRGGSAVLYAPEYSLGNTIVLYTGFNTQGTFASSNNGKTPAFLLSSGFPALIYPSRESLTPSYGAVPVGQSPTTAVPFLKKDRSTGYLYQYSFNVQRTLAPNLLLEIGYIGTFGHHLSGSSSAPLNINQVPTNLLGSGNLQSKRPFPQFGNVQMIGADIGRSNYNGVNVGMEKRMSGGLQIKANYTYSKYLDNLPASSDLAGNSSFTNYYNRSNDWGLSGNDIRHRFIASALYALPIHPTRRVLRTLLGGWSINGIGEFHTGTPLNPIELTNSTNSYSTGVRPNVVGDPDLDGDRPRSAKLAKWFDTPAFSAPAAYTFGNAGRSFGTGPSLFSMDGSLLKEFTVERCTAQFRVEVLNLGNHANFANPVTQRGSATFGQVTSLVSGNQARIVQLGFHLAF
jgi:hypothetical protein